MYVNKKNKKIKNCHKGVRGIYYLPEWNVMSSGNDVADGKEVPELVYKVYLREDFKKRAPVELCWRSKYPIWLRLSSYKICMETSRRVISSRVRNVQFTWWVSPIIFSPYLIFLIILKVFSFPNLAFNIFLFYFTFSNIPCPFISSALKYFGSLFVYSLSNPFDFIFRVWTVTVSLILKYLSLE